MSAATLVSVEEYLRTSYEHDREYVRGEVVERGMPTWNHGRTQLRLGVLFARLEARLGLYAVPELRTRLKPDVYRIPDLAVYHGKPGSQIPSSPPLIAIEIASPDDRPSRLAEKYEEYRQWGVPHIWVVDPDERRLFVHDGSLHEVEQLTVSELGLSFGPSEVFE